MGKAVVVGKVKGVFWTPVLNPRWENHTCGSNKVSPYLQGPTRLSH